MGNFISEDQEVPHGAVRKFGFSSRIIGAEWDYYVYQPSNYNAAIGKLWPVLYLFHGFSDLANAWLEKGQARLILDSLIAKGRAKPMLVVMPLGYGIPNYWSLGDQADDRATILENLSRFRDALLVELMPRIQHEFRVYPKRPGRAIAGLSMGGTEALFVGLNHPELFACIGAFSAGKIPTPIDPDFLDLNAETVNRSVELLYLSCGKTDWLLDSNRQLVAYLREKGVAAELQEVSGTHEWPVWRRNLAQFLEQCFKGL